MPSRDDVLYWSAIALLSVGAAGYLWQRSGGLRSAIGRWFGRLRGRVKTPSHNSDKQPPPGFVDHVIVIVESCPTAPPDEVLKYCRKGLTESGVLLEERKRLEELVRSTDTGLTT